MTEAEKRRAEAIWTYRISQEKVLKRLVEKEIFTQEHADYMSDYLFEQLNLLDVPGSHLSSIGEKMINTNCGHSPYVSLTDIARKKNGGTMAHPEIAEAFRAWLFPDVMLEMVKRYRSYQPELDEF